MSNSAKISVVIPSYNCANYVGEAIESVFNQENYTNFEILVIDDGSQDHTREILANLIQKYGERLRYIYQKNQGVSVARNHGIKLAEGEYIAFLDADDYFLPHKFTAQMQVFTDNPSSGIVHSGWRKVNSQGEFLQDITPWENVPHLDLEMWLKWKPVLPSAMIFRKDWLVKAGGFDPRFPPAEDTDLALRLAAMGCETQWLRQVTVCYRQHEESAMFKGLPQARSLAAVIDNFYQSPDLPVKIRLLEKQIKYNTFVWIAWYLYRTGHHPEMIEFLQRSWNYKLSFPMETIINWTESFVEYSRGVNEELDPLQLALDWDDLLQWTIDHG